MITVPEDFLHSVVFLSVDERDSNGEMHRLPKATGFFVRVPLESTPNLSVDYLVTARHCVEAAMPSDNLYLRLNKKGGGYFDAMTRCADWYLHDSADVAAILLLPSLLPPDTRPTDWDLTSLSLDKFVGPGPQYEFKADVPSEVGDLRVECRPAVGYETFFLGLFTPHYGKQSALPIARFGHLAMMPGIVEMKHGDGMTFQAEAYLMEFQSLGGHSGSPVFFVHPMLVQDARVVDGVGNLVTDVHLTHTTGFMGLVSGHFDIPQKAETIGDVMGSVQTAHSSGMAMVTPAEDVRELLMREDIVAERQALVSGDRAGPVG